MIGDLVREAGVGIVSFVVTGGVWMTVLAFRKDRREGRTSEVDLVERLMTTSATQQDRIDDLFSKWQDSEVGHAAVRREVGHVRAAFSSLARLTHPLVAWIDAGATPPPPAISSELRTLLAEVHAAEAQLPPPEIGPHGTLHPPRRQP